MYGVILAGGKGTRLKPLTHALNKHLLPVYDKPMIFYPVQCLVHAGIKRIVIVTHEEYLQQFRSLLGDGSSLGAEKIDFAIQAEAAGVADALRAAQAYVSDERMCVVLGDNLVGGSIANAVTAFAKSGRPAQVLVREVCDPLAFGVARFDDAGRLTAIVEKPKAPAPSNYAVTGIYFYDSSVFEVCARLKPSMRGELEITDVNNQYIAQGQMDCMRLHCWWCDVGTFEGIRDATELVRRHGANKDNNGGVTSMGDLSPDATLSPAVQQQSGLRFGADSVVRVLVTGGCGFIGSHFLRLLRAARPRWHLINFDCRTYAGQADNLSDMSDYDNYELVEGDVRDAAAVRAVVERCDAVVHLAAETHVDRSIADAQPFITTNVGGTQTLLDACRLHGHIKRFILVSTDEVYGSLPLDRPDLLFDENSPIAPSSPYAASKAAADLLCQAAYKTYGMDVVITRSSNNFGSHQFPEKVIPLFVTHLIDGKNVPLYGDGLNVRDWIHVEDNCEGILLALERGRAGHAYNLGGSNECSNKELTGYILAACGANESRIDYVKDRLGHDRRYAMDCSKAKDELGFSPGRSNFPDALLSVVKWYRDNETWWRSLQQKRKSVERTGIAAISTCQ